ncbi:MAG TPA: SDR family NAD(P)-dependent oxidoreductase [Acidimicrobiia bacterium]|nr:SDR family NAD(P)-dependent oxidoreductase [Acidimicrobiia bacterium]
MTFQNAEEMHRAGRLAGKTVVITGSGQNIGQVYAEHLASEGAAVVVADILGEKAVSVADGIRNKGGRAIAVTVDVSDRASCEAMAAAAVAEFGAVDCLVNNAAVFAGIGMKPMEEITETEWDRLMAVNVKGIWFSTLACLPQMRAQGRGRIVNIASSIARIGPPLLLHYAASKGAVQAMTRAMATELAEDNIRVTGLSPGMTFSGALDTVLPDPIMGDMFLEMQKIKEKVMPEHLAPILAFLCSDDAEMIIGQDYVVDGGFIFV